MSEIKIFEEIANAVINYDEEEIIKLCNIVIEKGIDPIDAIEKGLVKGVSVISDLYTNGELFITELILAGDVLKTAMNMMQPVLLKQKKTMKKLGTVVIGTVFGDIHDIGKDLVSNMLSINGFEVHDIGTDQPLEAFVEKVKEVDADIVGMSAMITTTRIEQKKIIQALKEAGVKVKTIIGGAMVGDAWAEEIGADAYCKDMIDAVKKAKMLMEVE